MVLRLSLALLVMLGTYLGAVVVERTFSPHVVGSASDAGLQGSDPWGKMKQELAARRRLALSGKEPPSVVTAATRQAEIKMSVIIPPPETTPSDR
jgi:hypothetical protein